MICVEGRIAVNMHSIAKLLALRTRGTFEADAYTNTEINLQY